MTTLATRRLRPPSEKQVEARVIATYRALGCVVYKLSQPRATMQTPGLPDLLVFAPWRTVPPWRTVAARAFAWHEVKRVGGKQSAAQAMFQYHADAAGHTYLLGGVDVAREWLQRIGVVAKVA